MRIQKEQLLALQGFDIPTERGGVGDDLSRVLLERHEDPGLAVAPRAVDQRLEPEHRLAGARSADHQRGATPRKTTLGNLVESGDTSRGLTNRALRRRSVFWHWEGKAPGFFFLLCCAKRSARDLRIEAYATQEKRPVAT